MKMNRRKRSVTIYVRNKQRYNPASKLYNFINVRVENFAGTRIGDIKEEARRQSGNNVKIDDLYLNNERLADDRSVAHYNLEDGTILETTSNPFWATCLFIKHCEAEDEQKKNLDNPDVQNWTNKSLARKRTLLSVLFNSKNEFQSQPPHFPTLDDFVGYLNNLKKKGATMNPYYTQRHLGEMYQDYLDLDVGRSSDPLGSFINRYAAKLGYRQPDAHDGEDRPHVGGAGKSAARGSGNGGEGSKQPRNRAVANRSKEVTCDDCEGTLAELYCGECQNAQGGQGLYLCTPCSQLIHAGAARRRHNVQDVGNAPKVSKPYIPHAFKAPFSILLGLYSGLTERRPVLSMTEDEIKLRAQPLTDTDLQDKQTGQYCGGFDCMEKILMAKGLVQREDSRNPTYALTETGEELAGQLYEFQQSVQRFLKSNKVPHVPQAIDTVCGTRKICLIIDEQERDKDRFLQIATERGVDVQFRHLGAGDYLWILTPPMASPTLKYTQQQPTIEKVLPFLVERKSWEDFKDSMRTKRFQKQVNHMLNSGVEKCFYLMEGSINSGRYKPSAEQQKNLKDLLEKIFLDNGFYINYTASWYKSAIWLLWATALASEAQRKGQLTGQGMTYAEFTKRTSGQSRISTLTRTDYRRMDWRTWEAEHFIDGIFRDSVNAISLTELCKKDLGLAERHVINIHGLEAYNKGRQTMLNKCLNEACGNPNRISDIVNTSLTAQLHNMLHYDVMSWWQLRLQFTLGVYIVRTEKPEDRQRIQGEIDWRSGGQPAINRRPGQPGQDHRPRQQEDRNRRSRGHVLGHGPEKRFSKEPGEPSVELPSTSETTDAASDPKLVFASDSQTENFMIQQALALSKQEDAEEQNRALFSSAKQPSTAQQSATNMSPTSVSKRGSRGSTRSGKRTSTATKEDEELELAIKLSLEDAANKRTSETVNRESTDPVMCDTKPSSMKSKQTIIPLEPDLNMDSQEELQYALELSKKTAAVTEEKDDILIHSDHDDDQQEPTEHREQLLPSHLNRDNSEVQYGKINPIDKPVCGDEKVTAESSEDEALKQALELSVKQNPHIIDKKSISSQLDKSMFSPFKNQSIESPVLSLSDQGDKDLELAIQLSLHSNSNLGQLTEGGCISENENDVIEIEDSQEIFVDHSKGTQKEKDFKENDYRYIVLDDSQEEPAENMDFNTVTCMTNDFIKSNNLETDSNQMIAEKEVEKNGGCLAPDTQIEKEQMDEEDPLVVPETVIKAETTSVSLHSNGSTLEPEPFQLNVVQNSQNKMVDSNTYTVDAKTSKGDVMSNNENSVILNKTPITESEEAENDDLDVIPPSPTSSQKSSLSIKVSKTIPEESTSEGENVKIRDKTQKDEVNEKHDQNSDGDSQDFYCTALVLPPLSPYNDNNESPCNLLQGKRHHTSGSDENYLPHSVKVKQEKVDLIESTIKNEEIVMDSQTLEDSQEELPKYDWIKESPVKMDQITVQVVSPLKKGSNSTSDTVKRINLSQGSTSNININIHIGHIEKTSQLSLKDSVICDDEEYAKRLQRDLDEEYELSKQRNEHVPVKMETRSIKKEVKSPQKFVNDACSGRLVDDFHDVDAAIAQSLHEELNSPAPKRDKELLLQDEKIAKQLNEEWNKLSSVGRKDGAHDPRVVEDEELVRSLQSIEKESQEDRYQQIQRDEDLARQLLESGDNYRSTGMKISSAKKRKGLLINDSPPKEKISRNESWRKNLFNENLKSKGDSLKQLQEIRREQSERFLKEKSGFTGISSLSRSPWSPVETKHVKTPLCHSSSMVQDSIDPGARNWTSSTFLSRKSSEIHSSSSGDQGEDEKPLMGTQSEALSKSKCGNCGEIGHTRKWVNCPRYYSHEESLRRQEQQAKARERIEAREREETQAKQDLEHHQRALKDIAIQIQEEQKGLEKTIKRLDKKKKQRENRHH
ncbi:uncharacterized protein LOC133172537 [Saccostrea echinata]|uniref:uncharacterized protein LOC133172537 n=1 Tax=Saccostrea echinata TaxID=191078 RepID=UPI002A80ABA2|nr:uncharacterized protein LOC133172537 [Saccostrea echinata]